MKKVFGILCITLLISIVTACGKGMIGTYELLEMESSGERYTAKDFKTLGIKYQLIIQDNNNAIFSLDGLQQQLTYNEKEFISKNLTTGENEYIPYKIENNKIIIEKNGEKFVFQK